MGKEAAIIGIGRTRWGKFPDKSAQDLGKIAVTEALKDAGIEWKDIQMVIGGSNQYSGILGLTNGCVMEQFIGSTGVPTVNIYNACATGGYTLDVARAYVTAGIYDPVICIGAFKSPIGYFGPIRIDINDAYDLDCQRYRLLDMANPAIFALHATRRMHEYGMTEEDLVDVKIKASKIGALNPYARYQKVFSREEILNSGMFSYPLRLFEVAATSDGAAAVIVCSKEKAKKYTTKPAILASVAGPQPLYPNQDPGFCFFGTDSAVSTPRAEKLQKYVARTALESAGIGPEDLDLAEVYDLSSNLEFDWMEDIGICKPGEAEKLLKEGATTINGRIPINPSGGVASFGESVPAQGLMQVCETVTQLRGNAGPRQVKNPKVGLNASYGLAHSCICTIVKK